MNKKLLFAAMSLVAFTACTDNDFESQKVAEEVGSVQFKVLNNNDEPLYFNTIEEAAEYVSGIVNQKVEANMTAIEKALDEYEEENKDEDVYFSFHEFQVVDD